MSSETVEGGYNISKSLCAGGAVMEEKMEEKQQIKQNLQWEEYCIHDPFADFFKIVH